MTRRRRKGTALPPRTLDGRLYSVVRLDPDPLAEAVAEREHPRQNSFDQSYMKGRYPAWVRRQGYEVPDEGDPILHRKFYDEPRPLGYNRPAAEEPYVQALAEFFDDRIAMMPPKPRQVLQDVKDRLHAVMHDGRSFEDQGRELGVSKQAVQQAQERAVEQLVESCGGKAALAESLRSYLAARDSMDELTTGTPGERLKYLPRWVHG
jgi:hypothetical protein